MWRVYVLSGLIACVVASATALITVYVASPAVLQARTVTLEGDEILEVGTDKVIYYRTPFASPPYLTTGTGEHRGLYKISDQKAESFRLENLDQRRVTVKWKAEGQPAK